MEGERLCLSLSGVVTVMYTCSLCSVQRLARLSPSVLPKYEVSVKLPKKITIQDEELKVAVCGL